MPTHSDTPTLTLQYIKGHSKAAKVRFERWALTEIGRQFGDHLDPMVGVPVVYTTGSPTEGHRDRLSAVF